MKKINWIIWFDLALIDTPSRYMATSVPAPADPRTTLAIANDGKRGVVEIGFGRVHLSSRISCNILNYGGCVHKMGYVNRSLQTLLASI
jgi:hypothetical protein